MVVNKPNLYSGNVSGSRGGEGGFFARNSVAKNYLIAMVGEFVGTFLFLFIGFSAAQAGKNSSTDKTHIDPSLLMYISLASGLSLGVNAWMFYRVSGGLFNPAFTAGFVLLGLMPAAKGVLLVVAQLLGAIAASGVTRALTGGLDVLTSLGENTSTTQGFFIEMFLTAEVALAIFMLAVEKHRATHLAPVAVGLSLFICNLVGIPFTGASLNPARSFGPALIAADFSGSHWIYWLGPLLGTGLAAAFYKFLLVVDYKTANPGQDHDGLDEESGGLLKGAAGRESGSESASASNV